MSETLRQLTLDNTFGFLDSRVDAGQVFHPTLVSNTGRNTMLKAILDELKRSNGFVFSVAFITPSAIAMLKQALLDFRGTGTIITSTYLGFNSPAAFRELLNLVGVEVYVHPDSGAGFHAKGYIFEQDASTTAIIGSSNLTESALLRNHEWNLRFSALPDGDIVQQLGRAVQTHVDASVALTPAWIDEYASTWVPQPRESKRGSGVAESSSDDFLPTGVVVPNTMQVEALSEIQKLRDAGENRAVVISATGTGKTILSALDVRAYVPKHMLFVVHREQILDRAIEEFKRVLRAPDEDFGKFVGTRKELDRRFVFASIQSLSRLENLHAIEPGAFDYVLIDEVHRAGAASYRRLIDYLEPDFLLGMTATPERTDDFNVFELFGFNVPYEIRLQKALEADMLAPFHYYGVTDFVRDGEVIDQFSDLGRLIADERVDHLVSAIETYGHAGVPVRGLIFCSRNDEAAELSTLLNQRSVHGGRLRTLALSGKNSVEEREAAVQMLEGGDLDYIATVDIFNEGIDIPSVNQVVMLRQTLSSIVFTQQLGRGLRKAAGKDHLVVIDFIGNYDNNYLIPIALFGDSSLSKDSIRKKIIDAQEAGAIAGLSSVNFDAISRERIFASLAATKLDSMTNLKKSFVELKNRLGRPPRLIDFARFDLVDPNVIATKQKNYWRFLNKVGATDAQPTEYEGRVLTFLSGELLNGKRPHELLLLNQLLSDGEVTTGFFKSLLESHGLAHDSATIESVMRVLSLSFYTVPEIAKYGSEPIVALHDSTYSLGEKLSTAWRANFLLQSHVRDVIETGLYLSRHRYKWSGQLEVGQRYSRKDVCRLLNWESNQQGNIFGYKVDFYSNSCPIFVTYHKGDEVSESTKYEDAFLDQSSLTWFTRSKRTLASGEVKAIVENRIPLHLFAKKDDAEGTDFYYLGKAISRDARQTKMSGDGEKGLDVVTMQLGLESPIEQSLYEYFATRAPV
ncbi:DUF3427 domain-containing protein [Leifsonia kafniensis]|uniref:DUF3427 domain-containing protein n=1 Tax=Leifsonia kafniensis TaxID=475957 RepID=A0ABP7KV08_9MICO